jgi:crotonobetainyl-CoA:carnitine CoA-transferase CaiB-like acyl-CoA transferase
MSHTSAPLAALTPDSRVAARGGPLEGIRVLELATVIMGPYAGQLLGDLGADVIKVEHGVVDSSRVMGGGPDPELSGIALNLHRNKRSIGLNLKLPEGRAALLRLLETCDVLVTNLRPGPLARLGLSYEDLAASMPQLIYCQSQGFARGSEDEDRPAYDDIIQAMTGLPWLNHEVLGQTAFVPTLLGDKVVGLTIAYGVLAALFHRERTGEGQRVEVPMFDAVLSFNLVEHLSAATVAGGRAGYSRIMSSGRGPHRTLDGYVAIMPYTDANWEALCSAIDRRDILERPWFSDHQHRLLHADRVFGDLAEIVAERTTEEWLEICARHDIPASAVSSLNDIVNDAALHRGLLVDATHPVVGDYRQIGPALTLSATPGSIRRHAPLVAQHTKEILSELGYTSEEIAALVTSGAASVARDDATEASDVDDA